MIVLCISSVSADRKIFDENGNWTGLINANPDPNGEVWTVGGYRPMTHEEEAAIPEMPLAPKYRNRPLPATVDNTLNPEFRPIFNQVGGSCAQASSVAYIYTYEMNVLRKLASNTPDNQFPYGYTYDFLNGGSTSNGSSSSGGWSIIKTTGCPNVTVFGAINGGLSGTAWMKTYDSYHKANFNRVVSTYKIAGLTVPDSLTKLKNYLYDHANGSTKGGCVVFSSYHGFDFFTIATGPYSGKKIALIQSGDVDHCMTFAGYSDEVGYDFNGDGKITNDVEVTGNDTLDVRDYEQGAVLLVNSWGTSFGNSGKVWLAYRSLGSISGKSVSYPTVALNTPFLELKVNFTHDTRNTLVIKTGFSSNLSATTPSETKSYGNAFNKSGGANPLEGKGGSSTIEIGLDISSYTAKFVGGKGKVFLQIASTGGTGQVNSLSAMDYTGGATPVETKCDQSNVAITGTINMGIAVTLTSPTPIKPSTTDTKSAAGLIVEKTGNAYMLTLPSDARHTVRIVTMQGRTVESFVSNQGQTRYMLGKGLGRGVYMVNAVSAEKVLSKRITVF